MLVSLLMLFQALNAQHFQAGLIGAEVREGSEGMLGTLFLDALFGRAEREAAS